MAKVSIGLRGWRFDESEVFTDDGEFRPLDEMPEESRDRLVRLTHLVDQPCDACYLVHGERDVERCREAGIVYGEPGDEVLLCADHEATFLYWYREAGGRDHRGDPTFRDRFHEWFAAGGRAPEGYAGLDHVETDPADLPDPPGAEAVQRRLTEAFDGREIDLRAAGEDGDADTDEDGDADTDEGGDADTDETGDEGEPVDLDDVDVDLGTDYPG